MRTALARNNSSGTGRAIKPSVRYLVATVGLLLCLIGIRAALTAGAARLLSSYGEKTDAVEPVENAIALTPADPEARRVRAELLAQAGNYREAAAELEQAVALRPRHYLLWVKLGLAREALGDQAAALAATREAVRLAPFYARPRWQMGNMLLRAGQREEAFAELRRAIATDPQLLPAAIDLAWIAYGRNVLAVEQAISPQTPPARLALARFFNRQGETAAALRLSAASGANEGQRALLTELLAGKRFAEAYEVWAHMRGSDPAAGSEALRDGGFEESVRRGEPGFGWQPGTEAGSMRLSLDNREPRAGAQSLRIEFSGASAPGASLLSQLALVTPGARYRLRFAARTEEIVTGGPLVLAITHANTDRELARVALPRSGGTPWQEYSAEFSAGTETQAVRVILRRENCAASGPCPIFGRLWLDDFALRRL